MDIEQAKKEFVKYTNTYDLNNKNIARKVGHTMRVMELSKSLVESLDLSKEEIELATLIGLLHDIARFEQMRIYGTFKDFKSVDHGDLGVEILKKDNFIRKFIKEDIYDDIIFKAIKNHNKYRLEEGLSEKEILFAKMIKDTDKIDIIYEGTCIFWNDPKEIEEINNSKITDKVYEQAISKTLVDKRNTTNKLDEVLVNIAFVFDINFKESLKIIKEKNYIEQILNRFVFKEAETVQKIEKIKHVIDEYIKSNI